MTSNFQTPPVWTNKMNRTPEALKEVKRRLAAKGLLAEDAFELQDFDLDEEFEDLQRKLNAGSRLGRKSHNRAVKVLIHLAMDERKTDAGVIVRALADGKVVPLKSRWWQLVCFLYNQDGLGSRVESSLLDALRRQTGSSTRSLRNAPDALASMVVSSGATLNEVNDASKTIPGSPLNLAVWARLLSIEAAPWVANHSRVQLSQFLESVTGTQRVGLVGRQLLEPAHDAGLEPGDVGPGTDMAKLVELIVRHLPSARTMPAWRALGPKATEVIDWCDRQKKLDKYFRKWDENSQKQRGAFWRGYIKQMRDVRPFDSANAIAMLIDGYWYIEFGAHGNACYRYSNQQFSELMGRLVRGRAIIRERHLKNPKGDLNSEEYFKLSHKAGWQSDFAAWINNNFSGIRQESPRAALRGGNRGRRGGW